MPKPRHRQPPRPVKKTKPATTTKAKARPAAKAVKASKPKPGAKAAARKPASPAKKNAKRAKSSARASASTAAIVGAVLVPAGPSPHLLAVETFERGFQALQQRQFGRAAELLSKVVDDYPDEKELQERARVYLNICERQRNSHGPSPRSLEERINAATVAINRGAFNEGLALLRKLEADHGDHDHVHYMLCVVYTVLSDFPNALEHLRQAIALNHENRYLAVQDADLDPLRHDPGFAATLDTPPAKPKAVARRR